MIGALEIRQRWAGWLRTVLKSNGLNKNRLAIALIGDDARLRNASKKQPASAIQGSAPRSLVDKWLKQQVTVSPGNAFRVAEALRELGCRSSSGPVGLFAAGHFPILIELLGRLSAHPKGRWPALVLYFGLPEWFDSLARVDLERSGLRSLRHQARRAEIACTIVAREDFAIVKSSMAECNGGEECAFTIQQAIAAASPRRGVTVDAAFRLAWNALWPWANDLYVRLGGDETGSPGYRWLPIEEQARLDLVGHIEEILQLEPL